MDQICHVMVSKNKVLEKNGLDKHGLVKHGLDKYGSNVPTNPITIARIFPHWPMEQI